MAYGYITGSANGSTTMAVSGSPASLAYGVNNNVGDLLMFGVRYNGNSVGTVTIQDTLSNTYNTAVDLSPGSLIQFFLFYAIATHAGANTVQFQYTGTAVRVDAVCAAYTGMTATATFDKTANGTGIGTAADSGATATTTTLNEVLIGLGTNTTGLVAFTAGVNYSLRIQQDNIVALEDRNVTALGAYHATGTWASSETWTQVIATFAAIGFIISGNAGTAGATVSWSGAASGSTVADGSGNYTITGLLNGAYTITPSLLDFTFSPTSSSQTVSGANISGVNFTATPSGASGTGYMMLLGCGQ